MLNIERPLLLIRSFSLMLRSSDGQSKVRSQARRTARGRRDSFRERIGEIEGRSDTVGQSNNVCRSTTETLRGVAICREQGIVEYSEAGPQDRVSADPVYDSCARIPVVVVGPFNAPGISINSGECQTAFETITRDNER